MRIGQVIVILIAIAFVTFLLLNRKQEPNAEDYENAQGVAQELEDMIMSGQRPPDVNDLNEDQVLMAKIPQKSEGYSNDADDNDRYYYYSYAWPASGWPPALYDKMSQFTPNVIPDGWAWFMRPGFYIHKKDSGRWVAYKNAYYYIN